MAVGYNPRIVTDGLVLALDTGNTKSFVDVPVQGQQAYTTPGTHSWTCPAGVYSVSAVVVGGGGGGAGGYGQGGAGGGLAYKNNISVTPGQSYTVVVGSGGTGATDDGDGSIWTMALGSDGGDSYFVNTSTVRATGGSAATSTSDIPQGGTNTAGDGGGTGGLTDVIGLGYHWPGGGAGGYSGDGGRTGSSGSSYAGHSGTDYYGHDGAGGGGGGGGYTNSHGGGGGGGGVGIYGEGTSGSGGQGGTSSTDLTAAGGGSGGTDGATNTSSYQAGNDGGNYGGGGGCSYYTGGDGGGGAVRIIWGPNRSFPSTNTADVTPQAGATNWGDISGKGNNGTLTNGPTYSSNDGGYLDFDGTNDYIQLPASSDLDFGTGNFTIEGWFNKDATTTLQVLLCSNKYYTHGYNGNWILRISSATQIAFAAYNGTSGTDLEYLEFNASTSVNTWYHFALVREGTGTNETKFYLDGVLKGSMMVSKSLTDAGTNGLRIGEESDNGPGNNFFNGKISNVKIYKGKGFTAAEVLQNYNALKGRYGI